jgi:hypothetical protein
MVPKLYLGYNIGKWLQVEIRRKTIGGKIMKKMLFGTLLTLCGVVWMVVLTALSIVHPWSYNDATGLLGFLLGSKTLWAFILAAVMAAAGIGISYYEAYVRK